MELNRLRCKWAQAGQTKVTCYYVIIIMSLPQWILLTKCSDPGGWGLESWLHVLVMWSAACRGHTEWIEKGKTKMLNWHLQNSIFILSASCHWYSKNIIVWTQNMQYSCKTWHQHYRKIWNVQTKLMQNENCFALYLKIGYWKLNLRNFRWKLILRTSGKE